MATIHDDVEILIGDFQAGNKAKLNKKQLEEFHKKELDAIEKMAKNSQKQSITKITNNSY